MYLLFTNYEFNLKRNANGPANGQRLVILFKSRDLSMRSVTTRSTAVARRGCRRTKLETNAKNSSGNAFGGASAVIIIVRESNKMRVPVSYRLKTVWMGDMFCDIYELRSLLLLLFNCFVCRRLTRVFVFRD